METKTRSGRIVKQPERYVPVEQVEDDFSDSEYNTEESDVSSEVSYESDDMSDSEDADDQGNLKGFVVDSDEEVKSKDGSEENGDSDDSSSDGAYSEESDSEVSDAESCSVSVSTSKRKKPKSSALVRTTSVSSMGSTTKGAA